MYRTSEFNWYTVMFPLHLNHLTIMFGMSYFYFDPPWNWPRLTSISHLQLRQTHRISFLLENIQNTKIQKRFDSKICRCRYETIISTRIEKNKHIGNEQSVIETWAITSRNDTNTNINSLRLDQTPPSQWLMFILDPMESTQKDTLKGNVVLRRVYQYAIVLEMRQQLWIF